MSEYTAIQFTDEEAAIAHVEASRWADGVTCPHCGSSNVHRMGGKTQAGYFLCNDCRDKFTCRTGTVMERSHIPVHKWLYAIHLMSSSKKGVSAHQLHRSLNITYKSAWFLAHRIREAMRPTEKTPLGGEGKIVEIDETAQGKIDGAPKGAFRGMGAFGRTVLTLVERGGSARSFHITGTTIAQIMPIVRISRKTSAHATFMIHRSYCSPQAANSDRLQAAAQTLIIEDQRIEHILKAHLKIQRSPWRSFRTRRHGPEHRSHYDLRGLPLPVQRRISVNARFDHLGRNLNVSKCRPITRSHAYTSESCSVKYIIAGLSRLSPRPTPPAWLTTAH